MKIAIIGAGNIGRTIAVDCLLHKMSVVLIDVDISVLTNASRYVNDYLRAINILNMRSEIDDNINFVCDTNLSLVSSCNIIIENIPENLEMKRKLHKKLSMFCMSGQCIMVNTSCIPISKISLGTNLENKTIGVHFMNPSYLKPIVEVVPSCYTDKKCVEITKKFLSLLEKEWIFVKDYAGFVSNRLSHLLMNQAAIILEEYNMEAGDVDNVMKKCFGHQMGPLETADLIGLDTVMLSLDVLYSEYKQTQYKCCYLIRQKVSKGETGKKAGKGFYKY